MPDPRRVDHDQSMAVVHALQAVQFYSLSFVPGRSVMVPDPLRQALAATRSPTTGMPVPLVDAAVTLPVNEYSVEVPHMFGVTCVTDECPIVVVAPLLLQVNLPPVAKLVAGALAVL